MRKQRHASYFDCPIESALDLIGGKWKASILFNLMQRKHRFSELFRLYPKITQRTLTRQLRELEADGLVDREVFPEIPPRVEYQLSEKGRTLAPLLEALFVWGLDNAIGTDGRAIKTASPEVERRTDTANEPAATSPVPGDLIDQ